MAGAALFAGWIGYGTALSGSVPVEPTDTGYVRQPIVFDPLSDKDWSYSTAPQTLGPPVTNWGLLVCVGLFDSVTGGNCFYSWMLERAFIVPVGQTHAIGVREYRLRLNDAAAILSAGGGQLIAGEPVGKAGRQPLLAANNITITV